MEEQDITIKYRAKTFADLTSLIKGDQTLFIGELVQTQDRRILIPKMGQQTANLFVIFGATDELTPVKEFHSFYEAEEFLLEARADGWSVMRGRDILPGMKWLSQFRPHDTYSCDAWVRTEFPEWLLEGLIAA